MLAAYIFFLLVLFSFSLSSITFIQNNVLAWLLLAVLLCCVMCIFYITLWCCWRSWWWWRRKIKKRFFLLGFNMPENKTATATERRLVVYQVQNLFFQPSFSAHITSTSFSFFFFAIINFFSSLLQLPSLLHWYDGDELTIKMGNVLCICILRFFLSTTTRQVSLYNRFVDDYPVWF